MNANSFECVHKGSRMNRAATVKEWFSQPKPYRFLTGAALKEAP